MSTVERDRPGRRRSCAGSAPSPSAAPSTAAASTGPSSTRSTSSPEIFGIVPNAAVLHQVVTAQLAAARVGHPVDQDPGRGRAAAGPSPSARRAPAGPARARPGRRSGSGGGVALGPKPRSYRQRTPKKMIRLALLLGPVGPGRRGPGGPGRRLGLRGPPDQGRRGRPGGPRARAAGCWWSSAPTTASPTGPSPTSPTSRPSQAGRAQRLRHPAQRLGGLHRRHPARRDRAGAGRRPTGRRWPPTAEAEAGDRRRADEADAEVDAAAPTTTPPTPRRPTPRQPTPTSRRPRRRRRRRRRRGATGEGRQPGPASGRWSRRSPTRLMDDDVYVFVVAPDGHQDRRPPRRRAGLRGAGDKVNTLNRKGKARRNRRTNTVGHRPDTKRAIVTLHERRQDRPVRELRGRRPMPLRTRKPTSAGRRFQTVSDFSEITRDRPERSLRRAQARAPAAATATAARRPATAAAATSSSTGSSTSGGTRTACRPRWRPSSTTPTATPASPCCTTTTARSATSWPRPR